MLTRSELNEDLSPRVPGDHRLRRVLAGAQGRRIHEHRQGAGSACQGRTTARVDRVQAHRLPGRHAHGDAAAGEDRRTTPRTMLRADLENENDTIRAYRERVRQCEAMQEYAIAEDIREILRQEQEHQIDLATALGEDTPDVSGKTVEDLAARTVIGTAVTTCLHISRWHDVLQHCSMRHSAFRASSDTLRSDAHRSAAHPHGRKARNASSSRRAVRQPAREPARR